MIVVWYYLLITARAIKAVSSCSDSERTPAVLSCIAATRGTVSSATPSLAPLPVEDPLLAPEAAVVDLMYSACVSNHVRISIRPMGVEAMASAIGLISTEIMFESAGKAHGAIGVEGAAPDSDTMGAVLSFPTINNNRKRKSDDK